jgi:hypothetical protein|tara:strand:+ start:161 stop:316 length:156 start_codon:yes stop_codon:yes gene_type:complete
MEEREEIINEIIEQLEELKNTSPLNSFYQTSEIIYLSKKLQTKDNQLSKIL